MHKKLFTLTAMMPEIHTCDWYREVIYSGNNPFTLIHVWKDISKSGLYKELQLKIL